MRLKEREGLKKLSRQAVRSYTPWSSSFYLPCCLVGFQTSSWSVELVVGFTWSSLEYVTYQVRVGRHPYKRSLLAAGLSAGPRFPQVDHLLSTYPPLRLISTYVSIYRGTYHFHNVHQMYLGSLQFVSVCI